VCCVWVQCEVENDREDAGMAVLLLLTQDTSYC
jgi:hypothetical protein